MEELTHPTPHEDPGELLESLRWTEQLARRLVRDSALAADVHQDTWTRALELFGGAVPGREWLAGTLRSMAYRARRSQRRRRLHEAHGAHRAHGGRVGEESSTDELIERSEAQQRVAAATARLPRDMRVVLLLRFQEGFSLAAVAKELGCSKSAAGERVQRGLAALRRELDADSGGWRSCCILAVPFGAGGAVPFSPSAGSIVSPLKPATSGLAPGAVGASSTVLLTGVAMKKLALVLAVVVAALVLTLDSPPPVMPQEALEAAGGLGGQRPVSLSEKKAQVAALETGESSRTQAEAAASTPPRDAQPDPATVFVFRARVVDSAGQPVAGARLWTEWRRPMHEALGNAEGKVELVLDQGDLDELSGSDLHVKVGAGPYLTLWSQYIRSNGTSPIAPPRLGAVEDLGTVTLGPAGAIEGHAYSTSGEPIAGATIEVFEHDEQDLTRRLSYRGVAPRVATDVEGRFFAGHLLDGSAVLGVRHPEFLADTPLTFVEVKEGVTSGPVVLRARAASIVTGRVLGREREPIEGALVNGTGNWSVTDTVETGPDGRFRIGLREGAPAPVECHLPGWRQVRPGRDVPQHAGEIEILMEPLPNQAAAPTAVKPDDPPKEPNVSGRLLLGGEPLVGARVLLYDVSLQLASPRELLEGARTVRLPTEKVSAKELTGRGGYSPVSTLGLEGAPPAYRLLPLQSRHGTFTDEEGRFEFAGVKAAAVALVLRPPGRKSRTLGTYQLANGSLEIGDVDVEPAATLVGQLESSWPWDPRSYVVRTRDPDLKAPLDRNGGFVLQGLQPGASYFTVERAKPDDDDEAVDEFENVPTFHVDLAPGETRSVVVNLGPYAPSAVDLEVTLGGAVPLSNCLLHVAPIDEPGREFRLFCEVDGSRITSRTRALGPCHLRFSQASDQGGFTEFALPGGPLDLLPGETARRKVDIPAGRIALVLPAGHPGRSFEQFDLVLEGSGSPCRVAGIGPYGAEDEAGSVVLTTVFVPAGSYRARLLPARWVHKEDAVTELSNFDVKVVSGETVAVTLPL